MSKKTDKTLPDPVAEEIELPDETGPEATMEDLYRVINRQGRVIDMLKIQLGNLVVANTEQSAYIEESRSQQ